MKDEERFRVITRNQFGEDEICSFALETWRKHNKKCFKKEELKDGHEVVDVVDGKQKIMKGKYVVQLVDKIPVDGFPGHKFQEVCRGCKNRVLC